METKVQRFTVKGSAPVVPEGFAPLEGEDLRKWQDAKVGTELFGSHVRLSEARIREHENGLQAAKLQLQMDEVTLGIAQQDLVKVEMGLGIEKPSDLMVVAGKIFRRVNAKAKEEPAAAPMTLVPPEETKG